MAKIEVVKQHDLKDCGPCCIQSIIKYYGGYVPLEKIREDTYTNINGTTAYHIINALNSYGFEAIGVKVNTIFDTNIYLPAIAHLVLKNGLEHFAVIYKINARFIYLMDPARGKIKISVNEFLDIWDKVLILCSPSNNLLTYNSTPSIFMVFSKLLVKNKFLFAKILIVNFIFMLLTIVSSFYFQIGISSIEMGRDTSVVKFVVLFFLIIILFKIIINYIKNQYLNYLNKNLDTEIFSMFLEHIFKLPLKFIQNRTTGEIVSRIDELSDTKNIFSEIFTTFILNMILIIGAVFTLYFLNSNLFFVLCLLIAIYLILGVLFSKHIYFKIKKTIETTTEFNTVLIENVDMSSSIKNLNLVNEFIYRVENKLILMLKNNFLLISFLNIVELLKSFVYEIGLFLISTIGIYYIYKGELDILSLVTFNSLILYLFNPIKELVDLIPKYNYLKASFNKLSDFLATDAEHDDEGLNKLDINMIKISNLSYTYDSFNKIIDNVNFTVNSKDKVLLCGPSGSGKSTICKILYRSLGSYSGNIEFNNTSEYDYSLKAIRENILYVGQNEKLFTGTIKDNIVCFRNISDEEFLQVCRICKLEEIVNKRPNRYNTVINAAINNLSGGEKQRIILARALLKKAKIIIIDEALSEVNLELEKEILDNIKNNYQDCILLYVSHKDISSKFNKIIRLDNLC